jgi:hypothetical protein
VISIGRSRLTWAWESVNCLSWSSRLLGWRWVDSCVRHGTLTLFAVPWAGLNSDGGPGLQEEEKPTAEWTSHYILLHTSAYRGMQAFNSKRRRVNFPLYKSNETLTMSNSFLPQEIEKIHRQDKLRWTEWAPHFLDTTKVSFADKTRTFVSIAVNFVTSKCEFSS